MEDLGLGRRLINKTGLNTTHRALTDDDTETRTAVGIAIPTILLLLIMALSVLGNTAVIVAILKTPRLREKTSSLFLINLSLTDLMNATLVMPGVLVSLVADRWLLGTFWCYAQCAFNYWFIIVSMLTLAMISIDGYYAVTHPMHYSNIITPKLTKFAICYAWLQGCAFALVPSVYRWVVYDYWEVVCAIDWDAYSQDGALTYVIVAFICCFFIPATIMTFCYSKICRIAWKKAVGPEGPGDGVSNARPHRLNDLRVIQSLVLLVVIFFLCMTPFCVTKLVKIFTSTSVMPPYVYLASSWFGYLASATNPLIYAIFRRDFRLAFKNLLCRSRFFNETRPPTFRTSRTRTATVESHHGS